MSQLSFKVMSIFMIISTAFSSLHAQNSRFDFEFLSAEHGLPRIYIPCIFQDTRGFMWFGSGDGLIKYDGTKYSVYKYDIEDTNSISDNWIFTIYEDKEGTLWIGTNNGLNRYDRNSDKFTRFVQNPEDSTSLNGHLVRAIHEDKYGNFWIGIWSGFRKPTGGLFLFDRKTGKSIRFKHDPKDCNSLSDNSLRFIVEDDDGMLWLGTERHGLNRFDPRTKKITRYLHDAKNPFSISHNWVWSGIKDRDGNLWFATWGGGLNKYDSGIDGFIHYQHDANNSNSLYSNFIIKIFQDSYGKIWICNGLLSQFDPATERFTHLKFSDNHNDHNSSYAPLDIFEDKSFNLWVGTRLKGIIKIDQKPKKFIHYTHDPNKKNSLGENDIQGIFEDSSGKLWIFTRENGLDRFDPETETFTHFKYNSDNANSLSHNYVNSVFEDRTGTIWVGTKDGLNKYIPPTTAWRQSNQTNKNIKDYEQENGKFIRYVHDPKNLFSLSDNRITQITEDHTGTLWVGTYDGLNKFDRKTENFYRFKAFQGAELNDENNIIYSIHEDRFNNLWLIISWGRLFLFDRTKGKFERIHVTGNDNPSFGLKIIEDRQGLIWGLLCRVDYRKKLFQHIRIVKNTFDGQGFETVDNHVNCVFEDKNGKFWCGTNNGLHKFDPQTNEFVAHYFEKDGLARGLVIDILNDEEEHLWLLTGSGICIFNENNPPGKQFKSFDLNDGVINSASKDDAFIKSKNGDIYWGGTHGLYRFFSNAKQTNLHIPPIVLTDFKKFDKSVKLDTNITEIKTIRLKYNENFFSISFAALDFTNPRQNQYVYQLEGFDKEWIEVGNRNQAYYTNIPPGNYIFRVKGSNNDGIWNEKGTSVNIKITPPYWATWWFRSTILIVLLGIGYSFHRYRLQKRREIELTRNRIARDLHDDVSSSLSSIALASELIENKDNLGVDEKRLLIRIRTTSQRIMEAMDDIVWSVNPEYDKLDNVLLRMKDFAADLFSKSHIVYSINFPEQECLQNCYMNFRRNLFLIYKEILHNVVKHARASHVNIDLAKNNGTLILNVSDDGNGFDLKNTNIGNGLKSMQIRAKEINGKLVIDSKVNQGTDVKLKVAI